MGFRPSWMVIVKSASIFSLISEGKKRGSGGPGRNPDPRLTDTSVLFVGIRLERRPFRHASPYAPSSFALRLSKFWASPSLLRSLPWSYWLWLLFLNRQAVTTQILCRSVESYYPAGHPLTAKRTGCNDTYQVCCVCHTNSSLH
jgi:hypothetical protein